MQIEKTPTTVISGFLGSGKTTIILDLVSQLRQQKKEVVYIKNEVGDTDVDAQVLQGKDIKTTELLNGCICCTLVGPFASAITEVVTQFKPDRVIIEASGAADPAALALMVDSHPLLRRDGVLCVVDVLTFEGFSDLSVTAQNQARFTDLILFNKVELASIEQKKRVVGYVRELNEHSPILESIGGTLPMQIAFGVDQTNLNELLTANASDHAFSTKNHVAEDEFQAFSYSSKKALDEEKIISFLEKLPKNVFRAKGFWRNRNGNLYLFNSIAGRTTTTEAPKNLIHAKNTAVFIGYQAKKNSSGIIAELEALLNTI